MAVRVVLTGATGFIGGSLTAALRRRGWRVTALLRRPDSPAGRALAAAGVSIASGDVTDRTAVEAALSAAEPEIVIHNAGVYEFGLGARARARMTAVNVEATRHLLDAAAECRTPRVVYVSSVIALGETGPELRDETFVRQTTPTSYYETTKAEAHALAVARQRAGAPVVIVSPGGVIGPGDHSGLGHLLRLFLRGWPMPVAFGADGTRTTVHVEDCAEAIALAAERGSPGGHYILGSGETMSYQTIFELWGRSTGRHAPRWYLPRPAALAFCAAAEPVQRLLGLPMVFCREFARNAFTQYRFTGGRAERELGIRFRPPEQAWRDTIDGERARLG